MQSLVDAFGKKEVEQWRWFVGTEIENRDWWEAEDGTGSTTRDELFKLHDWSVFAVTRVLGEACGPVGSHAMMSADGANGWWDPCDFIAHCRSGRNHATGRTGARLDFFAVSCYDRAPGRIQEDEMKWSFPNTAGIFQDSRRLSAAPEPPWTGTVFPAVPIEVSEGGVLFGMDGKWLWHGLCPGGMFDASWTALAFWKMLENGVSRWSRWPLLRTGGLFQGLEAPATHAMRMIARLAEDLLIPVTQQGEDQRVRVVASLGSKRNRCHVLAFHHAPDVTAPTPAADLEVRLYGLPFSGKVRIKRIMLADGHGDFWSQWVKDRTSMGLTDKDFFRSRDQLDVAHALVNPAHRFLWETKAREYAPSSAYPSEEITEATVLDGVLLLAFELSCFTVVLYEIESATR